MFADNAEMLDLVTDDIVGRFVDLIREVGREARFVEFLLVLCQCSGKAVRPNQWRVCKLLLQVPIPTLHPTDILLTSS